jgi:hypothetical protein
MRSAVVGEPEILERHGAIALDITPQSGKGIQYRGWKIWFGQPDSLFLIFCVCSSSSHGPMADENELIHLQQKISQRCGVDLRDDDVIVIDGHNLHIPPMLFLQV